mmetsp:Transcript_72002/g.142743  ORF Transcript_72002/g.142743 Transcript_72002/m.142743 type:complete len:296 (-) Transcript_72002:170-1057(-)
MVAQLTAAAAAHPITLQGLERRDPLPWVWVEQAPKERDHLLREVLRAHDANAVCQHGGISLALGGRGTHKRQRPREHGEENHPETPYVCARRVIARRRRRDEHLRCRIHDRAHLRVLQVGRTPAHLPVDGSEPEISHLSVVLGIKQDVLRLEIPMVHTILMAMRERLQDLRKVAPRVVLREAAALRYSVKKLAALAQLHHHVHPLRMRVHLHAQQLHNVRIVEARERRHLLASRPNDRGRGDLNRHVFARFHMLSNSHDAMSTRAKQPYFGAVHAVPSIRGERAARLIAAALHTA